MKKKITPIQRFLRQCMKKEFGSKIETYQKLITLLGDECNNVKINLFNNPSTGEKGILNVLNGKMKGQNKMVNDLEKASSVPQSDFAESPILPFQDLTDLVKGNIH